MLDNNGNVWNWSNGGWLSGTGFDAQTGRVVNNAPRAVTVAIAPDSQMDACYAQPKNGDKRIVSIGNPYPAGEWEGPWNLSAYRGGMEFVPGAPGIGLQARLSLDFYTRWPGFIPSKRAPDIYPNPGASGSETLNLPLTTSQIAILQLPFFSRKRGLISLQAGATVMTYSILGRTWAGGQAYEANEYPPAGTTTLAAGATAIITIEDDDVDFLVIKAACASGTDTAKLARFEARDE